MKYLFTLSAFLIFTVSSFCQITYIQNEDGQILEEEVFNKEREKMISEIRKGMSEDDYFDLIYEFEEPTISNDSIIIKVSSVTFSMYPPQMNTNNVFKEEEIIRKVFPIDSLKTLDGNTIDINDLKGKPTMVNIWHTTCGPCVKEMPLLNSIMEEYGDRVNFVAITFENKERVDKFLNKREFNFLHIIDAADFMNAIQFKVFPKSFYLDKDGVVKKIEGAISMEQKQEVTDYIDSLL